MKEQRRFTREFKLETLRRFAAAERRVWGDGVFAEIQAMTQPQGEKSY
jgi:hypothetical protein